jgi:hypothetical protein
MKEVGRLGTACGLLIQPLLQIHLLDERSSELSHLGFPMPSTQLLQGNTGSTYHQFCGTGSFFVVVGADSGPGIPGKSGSGSSDASLNFCTSVIFCTILLLEHFLNCSDSFYV